MLRLGPLRRSRRARACSTAFDWPFAAAEAAERAAAAAGAAAGDVLIVAGYYAVVNESTGAAPGRPPCTSTTPANWLGPVPLAPGGGAGAAAGDGGGVDAAAGAAGDAAAWADWIPWRLAHDIHLPGAVGDRERDAVRRRARLRASSACPTASACAASTARRP